MLTEQIRRKFLKFFQDHQHTILPSSPIIPHGDPSLLFVNAGMNQFKDFFLGKHQSPYKRITTCQKCIRVGGKHNDLENVGHTKRHLTFFEMLGNFSFGDYFKKQAIEFSWKVATEIFELEEDKIWASVFHKDEEAYELWQQYLPTKKIARLGEEDNFWAMGDTGPCGPCSELYYDRGSGWGTAKNIEEDTLGERYIEFWNLVFMEFNRNKDGELKPLPSPCIDTGAGLERIVLLKMNTDNIYETDILQTLIQKIQTLTKISYDPEDTVMAPAFRVIADHTRCLSFAIADGVQPGNIERGYILRKILRRAVRYGKMLGLNQPFLAKLIPTLTELMRDYKELQQSKDRICEILTQEEENFFRTLQRGGNILNKVIEKAQKHSQKIISGEEAFKLKDTYGFPLEEIMLIAKDIHLTVDTTKFYDLEQEAKEKSRKVHKKIDQQATKNLFAELHKKIGSTKFIGYEELSSSSNIIAIFKNAKEVRSLQEGEEGDIVLDITPFYAEKGGQTGDTGTLGNKNALFQVLDCQMPYNGIIVHKGIMKTATLSVHDNIQAIVNQERRKKIETYHTATHLLHWALTKIVGPHIKQAGSLVEEQRLRFDFSHHKALTKEEIEKIEDLVNTKILENADVKGYEIPYEEVKKREKIKQFFGDKYEEIVRVIDIDDEAVELCGGTHAKQLGNIGLFKIMKEGSIASGIRRIEAICGKEAAEHVRQKEHYLCSLATLLKTQPEKLKEKILSLLEENKNLNAEIKNCKNALLKEEIHAILQQKEMIKNCPALFIEKQLPPDDLKNLINHLQNHLSSYFFCIGNSFHNQCQLIVGVSEDIAKKGISANDFIKQLAPIVEGRGGGKHFLAQAGGKAPQKIPAALKKAKELLMQHLS